MFVRPTLIVLASTPAADDNPLGIAATMIAC